MGNKLIANRINELTASVTMKIAGKALTMKASGVDIIDFSVGEPDFPTPSRIKKAALKAIDENFTKYTFNSGMLELRDAISKKFLRDNNLEYDTDEIIVSNGAKQALFNVVMSVVNPGDEVIIPGPYYVSYPEMVKLAGGKPVIVNTKEKNGFKLTPEELKDAITSSTKALIVCTPSNPTGLVYTEDEIKALVSVIEKEKIFVISDEVYEKLIYDNLTFASFADAGKNIKDRIAVINGVSKAYAMTGWRIGYAAANKEIIKSASKIQSHNTSGASSISQYASLEALSGPQNEVIIMRDEFEKRRDYIYQKAITLFTDCVKPQGAFYIFPNISSFIGKKLNNRQILTSADLAELLLDEAKVALVPGEAFGSDKHIRISYSTSMENIVEGMNRIQSALEKIK
ncbi:MAG: pyridoxal phosphate-dependent aminotransferase [Bacteroidota bacterium]|nr:pyridoxal phosphate-dependent aminotransferase [Bacteroidota bacterium]MDP4196229.1 pyridoxal phosphate-dependent aminotransferase [Bacteroidota bacterium]